MREGDLAPDGSGPLHLERGIEIGHIFQLGRKYAKALGLTVLDENGKTQVVTMGSYGIGVTRVMAALAEANCDDKGLSWPAQIAPFDVHVLATGKGDEVFETAQSLGEQLDAVGLDVLVDDRRKVSAGVKFKDYELVGVPFGLVVGRSLADGQVEIRVRATGETIVVPVEEAVERLREAHAAALKGGVTWLFVPSVLSATRSCAPCATRSRRSRRTSRLSSRTSSRASTWTGARVSPPTRSA